MGWLTIWSDHFTLRWGHGWRMGRVIYSKHPSLLKFSKDLFDDKWTGWESWSHVSCTYIVHTKHWQVVAKLSMPSTDLNGGCCFFRLGSAGSHAAKRLKVSTHRLRRNKKDHQFNHGIWKNLRLMLDKTIIHSQIQAYSKHMPAMHCLIVSIWSIVDRNNPRTCVCCIQPTKPPCWE